MGREIRMVPAGWEHPKDERGRYRPLYDASYREAAEKWVSEFLQWTRGEHPDQGKDWSGGFYWEYAGSPPEEEMHHPAWTEPADHFQIYETVSEGTPVSPVFASRDALAEWLVSQGYSRAAAESFAKDGWAPSMVVMTGGGEPPRFFNDIESAALPRNKQ